MVELRLSKELTPLTASYLDAQGKKVLVKRQYRKYADNLTPKDWQEAGYEVEDIYDLALRMKNTDHRNALAVKALAEAKGQTVKTKIDLTNAPEII